VLIFRLRMLSLIYATYSNLFRISYIMLSSNYFSWNQWRHSAIPYRFLWATRPNTSYADVIKFCSAMRAHATASKAPYSVHSNSDLRVREAIPKATLLIGTGKRTSSDICRPVTYSGSGNYILLSDRHANSASGHGKFMHADRNSNYSKIFHHAVVYYAASSYCQCP